MAYTNEQKVARYTELRDLLAAVAVKANDFVADSDEADADPMPDDIRAVRNIGKQATDVVGDLTVKITKLAE